MKEQRSTSQVLYGLLPEQTVDIKSGVWRVDHWHVQPVYDVDDEALRQELVRLALPWANEAADDGYVRDLLAKRELKVVSLDRDKGVRVDAFPRTWRCRGCGRLRDKPNGTCRCGREGPHGQLPFVLFHDACGQLREPWYPRCRKHGDRALRLPGTTRLEEMRLYCPACNTDLGPRYRLVKCDCGKQGRRGENMEFALHRSAAVYTPRSVVIVNPPSRDERRRVETAGGAEAALRWVMGGMTEPWIDALPGAGAATLRATLEAQGLDPSTIQRMLDAMGQHGGGDEPEPLSLPDAVKDVAGREAVAVALSMSKKGARVTLADLPRGNNNAQQRYDVVYPRTICEAGLARVDLIEKFPVLRGSFGYTRGEHEPGKSQLKPFYLKSGSYVVYGDRAETEALLFRLKPSSVGEWLTRNGIAIPAAADEFGAHRNILLALSGPDPEATDVHAKLMTLVHSLAHRTIRQTSLYAGIDRNALSELLFPTLLSFVVYAEPRGDFVLGGLQALFENDLHLLLDRLVNDDPRCALDPGCGQGSTASCAVCLHLGEPSCRHYNTQLDRRSMFGPRGYLSQ